MSYAKRKRASEQGISNAKAYVDNYVKQYLAEMQSKQACNAIKDGRAVKDKPSKDKAKEEPRISTDSNILQVYSADIRKVKVGNDKVYRIYVKKSMNGAELAIDKTFKTIAKASDWKATHISVAAAS